MSPCSILRTCAVLHPHSEPCCREDLSWRQTCFGTWFVWSSKSIENIFPNPHEEVSTSAACEGLTLACKERSKDVPPCETKQNKQTCWNHPDNKGTKQGSSSFKAYHSETIPEVITNKQTNKQTGRQTSKSSWSSPLCLFWSPMIGLLWGLLVLGH